MGGGPTTYAVNQNRASKPTTAVGPTDLLPWEVIVLRSRCKGARLAAVPPSRRVGTGLSARTVSTGLTVRATS